MKTIQSQWEEYFEQVLKRKNITEIQKQTAEVNFYSGAFSMLCTLDELGRSNIPDEEGAKVVLELYEEAVAFIKRCIVRRQMNQEQNDAKVH
jgi:hypothetical protein